MEVHGFLIPRYMKMPGFKKPNYFLGVKITNPALLENVDKIQKQIIAENTGVAAFLEPPSKSHITLAVMNLSPDEVEACGSLIAEKFKPGFTVKQRTIQFRGIGNFGSRVLFSKPDEECEGFNTLHKIREQLQNILLEAGYGVIEVEKEYHPHLTMFKVRGHGKGRRKKRDSGNNSPKNLKDCDVDDLKQFYFGEEIIDKIQLLSMDKPKDEDGYYYCEKSFPLNGE